MAERTSSKCRLKFHRDRGLEPHEMRRQQKVQRIKLRKENRAQLLSNRRNVGTLNEDVNSNHLEQDQAVTSRYGKALSKDVVNTFLSMGMVEEQILFTRHVRELLCSQSNVSADEVIQSGLVPRFVEFLKNDNPELQFETVCVLSNIVSSSTEHVKAVVEFSAVPGLIQLLSSRFENLQDVAVWALDKIIAGGDNWRDRALSEGILPPLLLLLSNTTRLSTIKTATSCLQNLCFGTLPDGCPVLPVLHRLLFHPDAGVLVEACSVVNCFINMADCEKIQAVIEHGICLRLVQLLMHASQEVAYAALCAVAEIVSGNEEQNIALLNCSLLPCMLHLLQNGNNLVCREACSILAQITVGSAEQIQAVIEADIFPVLIELLFGAEFKTREIVVWSIHNALVEGTQEQIRTLAEMGCVGALCDLLSIKNCDTIDVVLDALEKVLQVGDVDAKKTGTSNCYAELVERNKLEVLQYHANDEISKRVCSMIDRFFDITLVELPASPFQICRAIQVLDI